MAKPKVFVTRLILDQGLHLVQEFCEADVWTEELPPSPEVLRQRIRGAAGLLCLLTDRIDREVLEAAGGTLRVISNHAVGVDNVDVAAATSRGIPVGNTPGILTDATADLTFALLMAAARRIVEGVRFVQEGRWKTWSPSLLLGADIQGATLGIVGFGRIGKAVAQRAAGFDMRVLFTDPHPTEPGELPSAIRVDLDRLLSQSDFISLHCPLSDQTRHLINQGAFEKMKPSAILVNTSRGGVVDPQALYTALKNRRISAAALDVTDPEPLPVDSPLLTLDNLIVVPHIASASRSSREKMSLMAAENLIAGLKGERLPHCVNPEVYLAAPDVGAA
jgi:lactate dehydrogenase-like 2-hydroxyacid dehydrogenase